LEECKDANKTDIDAALNLLDQCLKPSPRDRFQNMNDVLNHRYIKREASEEREASDVEGKVDKVLEIVTKTASDVDENRYMITKVVELAMKAAKDAPNHMLIIPLDLTFKDWGDISNLVTKRAKIVFVCPVTYLVPRDNEGKVKGYEVNLTRDWYSKYGHVLRISYILLKVALAIGSSGALSLVDSSLKAAEVSCKATDKITTALQTETDLQATSPDMLIDGEKLIKTSYETVKGIAKKKAT